MKPMGMLLPRSKTFMQAHDSLASNMDGKFKVLSIRLISAGNIVRLFERPSSQVKAMPCSRYIHALEEVITKMEGDR